MRSLLLGMLFASATLAGCAGLPPAEMRDRPVLATWTVKTEPDLTARCIARDIETEFYDMSGRASIHPGIAAGELEVFQFLTFSLLPFPFHAEYLRAIFTVQPDGTGSKIYYRDASESANPRIIAASKNWRCVK